MNSSDFKVNQVWILSREKQAEIRTNSAFNLGEYERIVIVREVNESSVKFGFVSTPLTVTLDPSTLTENVDIQKLQGVEL